MNVVARLRGLACSLCCWLPALSAHPLKQTFTQAAHAQHAFQDTVFNCQTDPTANTSQAASPTGYGSSGSGASPGAWVWVLVALASTAGAAAAVAAALLLLRRRSRRCGVAAKDGLPGSPATSPLVVVGQSDSGSLGSRAAASPRPSRTSGDKEEDLEKASLTDLGYSGSFRLKGMAQGMAVRWWSWLSPAPAELMGRDAALLAGQRCPPCSPHQTGRGVVAACWGPLFSSMSSAGGPRRHFQEQASRQRTPTPTPLVPKTSKETPYIRIHMLVSTPRRLAADMGRGCSRRCGAAVRASERTASP